MHGESRGSRSRGWAYTVFAPDPPTAPDGSQYFIAGTETCPTTGRIHQQCYVYFPSARSFNSMQNTLPPGTHIEVARGSPRSNSLYCKKDGRFVEQGELPQQGRRSDLQGVADGISAGASFHDLYDGFLPELIKYSRGIQWARKLYLDRNTYVGPRVCSYFWGEPGTGKTREAFAMYPSIYTCDLFPSWFDGYDGEETLLLDDYRYDPSHERILLRLCDRYAVLLPVKGASVRSRHKHVVITSNDPPDWISPALRRRFTTIREYINLI